MKEFRRRLAKAAELEHPYLDLRTGRRDGTPASVLMAWGFSKADPEHPQVLLTKRTDRVETHKGQMAFPGGMRDESDSDAVATALREAEEEVGLSSQDVEVIGQLPEMWTVTGFLVTPILALVTQPIESLTLLGNEEEIAEMLWVPQRILVQSYRREFISHGGIRYPIDVFLEEPHRVLGVTGSLLKNLVERLERVG